MRKLLISMMMLSSVVAVSPAAAQRSGGHGFDRQIDQIVDRIHRAENRDVISKREEARLLSEARQLRYLENRYGRGGFTRWEARDLQHRIDRLRAQFRFERADAGDFRHYRR